MRVRPLTVVAASVCGGGPRVTGGQITEANTQTTITAATNHSRRAAAGMAIAVTTSPTKVHKKA